LWKSEKERGYFPRFYGESEQNTKGEAHLICSILKLHGALVRQWGQLIFEISSSLSNPIFIIKIEKHAPNAKGDSRHGIYSIGRVIIYQFK